VARAKNPDGTPKQYASDLRRGKGQRVPPNAKPIVKPPSAKRLAEAKSPSPTRRTQHWSRDPLVQQRLHIVERYRLAGLSEWETGQAMAIDPAIVAEDWRRLNELWLTRISDDQAQLRGEAIRRLDGVIRQGLEILRMDEAYTQAVLFNLPVRLTCQGRQEHRSEQMLLQDAMGPQNTTATWGDSFSCLVPHEMLKRVHLDAKGQASYRRIAGQVLQAINGAIAQQAKINGLIVEKKALTDTEGRDLPTALRTLLLEDDPAPPARGPALPAPHLDNGRH